MQPDLSRPLRFALVFLFNFAIIIAFAYGFECFLYLTKPDCKLPFDTQHYETYRICFDASDIPGRNRYTWGHEVINNRYGFREREFVEPKPAGLCRIVVLGDSLTWGVGVPVAERYTNLAEYKLQRAFPDRDFEILNISQTGLSTTMERDILYEHQDALEPDLIVLAFYRNDLQPKSESYSIEREKFYAKYGHFFFSIFGGLIKVGLPHVSKISRTAFEQILTQTGIIPPYEVYFQRVYEEDSVEWQEFEQALRDIKALSDARHLPAPIFAVLNLDIYLDYPTDYTQADSSLPYQLRWNHQAEKAAAAIGFTTYNHEQEFLQHLTPAEIPLHALDRHPSAKVHRVYAQALFERLAAAINSGHLCS